MKTDTEYKKRKHNIKQDEDKQTEKIELKKLRKSSVKVFIPAVDITKTPGG